MIKNQYLVGIFLCFGLSLNVSLTHATIPAPTYDKEKIIKQLIAYDKQKTFIFSYPGSANTWIRYCLEYLTQRPSFARFGPTSKKNPVDLPLGLFANFPIDMNKPPLEKVHSPENIRDAKGKKEEDLLIFVLRNPKEVFVRNRPAKEIVDLINKGIFSSHIDLYFRDLALFHVWPEDKKILIYYEDLIAFPEKNLKNILEFLNEPLGETFAEFMSNYDQHKKKALSIKETLSHNYTNGEEVFFHSKKLSKADRHKIDTYIARIYPILWETYLKEAYAEDNGRAIALESTKKGQNQLFFLTI